MDKSDKTHQIISVLMKEARHSMNHEHFEDAVIKLQWCLQLEEEPEWRPSILDKLGYCFLRLGWFEEAVNFYTEYYKILPSDVVQSRSSMLSMSLLLPFIKNI